MEHKEEQEKASWDTFFHTGKVEDYLRYTSSKVGEITESIGEKTYAGYYSGNRDYIEAEPYRRIR